MELKPWTKRLRAVYDKAISLYRAGNRDDTTYFTEDETRFLASVGLRPINVYDYAEDFVTSGEPDWETYLLIAAARRDHFLFEQQGVENMQEIRADQLPSKRTTLEGIPWLPRIIEKAHCFLGARFAMTLCTVAAGDRHFLREHGLHPADFLRVVSAAKGDNQKILAFVKGLEKQSVQNEAR